MQVLDRLEIHFHDQDRFSVLLETNGGPDEKLGEILMCASFALRQLLNLGLDSEPARGLVDFLCGLSTDIKTLSILGESGGPQLVVYQGAPGRRRFLAELRYDGASVRFSVKAKGFGIRAAGVGYYAPTSVVALVSYLVDKHRDDDEYCEKLARALLHCAGACLGGFVTITNQGDVALAAATRPPDGNFSATGEALDDERCDRPQPAAPDGLRQMRPSVSDSELDVLLRAASVQPSYDELVHVLTPEGHAVAWADIDSSTKVVFEYLVRQQVMVFLGNFEDAIPQTESEKARFPDALRAEAGSFVFDGYLIGRRFFGTHERSVTPPVPEPVEDYNAARLHELFSGLKPSVYLDACGDDVNRVIGAAAAVNAEEGLYKRASDRPEAVQAAWLAMINGLGLAVAEHLLCEVDTSIPTDGATAT